MAGAYGKGPLLCLKGKLHTMTARQILQSDLLDIVFEKRNKTYGAYALRRSYNQQLVKAIGITASLVLLLLFFGSRPPSKTTFAKTPPEYQTTNVVLPAKPEPPKPKPQPPAATPPVKQAVLLDRMQLVDKTKTEIATQRDLDDALPGSAKVDAPPAAGIQPPDLPPANGTTAAAPAGPEKTEAPLPSRQPQFPGGTDAWLKFLSRNLRPPSDLESGEKRSVLVRFSVDEEGVITNFQVVQSGGADFDNEVIRVLKKMPRWLPAIQNGKPTAVNFTQPVTFQGE